MQLNANTTIANLPALNTPMPEHGGVFAGLLGGKDGQPYAAMILLDKKPTKKLSWANGNKWATKLGDGAHMPTKAESASLYANVPEAFDTSSWHWTSTPYDPPFSDSDAWVQGFGYGGQSYGFKSTERLCRAVRLIQLTT